MTISVSQLVECGLANCPLPPGGQYGGHPFDSET
jgi:hypothetical protein